MNNRLDAGTLDALVLGTEETEDHGAWESLVQHPRGDEAFREAVARRRHKDLLAAALLGRPRLARTITSFLTLSRKTKSASGVPFSLLFPDTELDALVSATLGPAEQESATEIVQPRWGQVVPVRLGIGERITLEPASGSEPVDVRYLCQGAEGFLPTRTWKLEAGEAPVLLVALVGARAGDALAEGMTRAKGLAGILVVDRASP